METTREQIVWLKGKLDFQANENTSEALIILGEMILKLSKQIEESNNARLD